ncbi:S-4TM family putative pore-forming effector, partial [Streptomyces collinus]|uniref:S-4TM family putative pore-forming effector n=2 Tax=Bacteria TaxID=2 RepID=UPI00378F1DE6
MSGGSTDQYEPPITSTMARQQNEIDSLRLLVAQRSLYAKAKRWMGGRWIGMSVIAIAAPIFA